MTSVVHSGAWSASINNVSCGPASFCQGEDDDDTCGEEKMPSSSDYIIHFLTVFWKLLFALVPPTEYWSGWACFIVCISIIGILTAIIGDIASHFGCTVGLKDSVTAVVFVALGTSVPGVITGRHLSTIHFNQKVSSIST